VVVDFSIMRGFDYYTSTVFEVFDKKGKFRALGGGGRYDDLVSDFGGDPCPGVGYGMGGACSALELFLKDRKLLNEYKKEVDYFVIPINKDMMDVSASIAKILRRGNIVELEVTGKGLRKAMGMASNAGAKKVVIVGPKDLEQEVVTIRDMKSGKEEKVRIDELA